MKRSLAFIARLLLLVVAYFLCFSIFAAILLPAPQAASDADNATTLLALALVSFLNASVVAFVVSRSEWTGWKLILTIWLILFGAGTLMPQIETAVFVKLPAGFLTRLFLFGFVFAAVFAPLAILILPKRAASNPRPDSQTPLSFGQWTVRLIAIALIYAVIYFTFGYFIAWKNPAVRAYYGGTDPGSFLAQIESVLRNTPWLVPLQICRGLLWTALAVPVVRMIKGHWWEAGLAVALVFGVLTTSPLLLPNPLMPQEVRMTHLLETATSNFLFGWLLVWVLLLPQSGRKKRELQAVSEG